jgi:hypothetical protein
MKLVRSIQQTSTRPITPLFHIHPPFEDEREGVRLSGAVSSSLRELLVEEENSAGPSLAQWLTSLRAHLLHLFPHHE